MRHYQRGLAALLLAGVTALPALASMPCPVPSASLSPPTNTTNAPAALRLSFYRRSPQGVLVRAEREDGTSFHPTLDGDLITGLDTPGWYRLHVFVPTADRQSEDRSLFTGEDEFWADVLVGRSDPGVALVTQCPYATGAGAQMISVRWSEDVRFQVDPQLDLELLLDGADAGLGCQARLSAPDAGYDGGYRRQAVFDCPAGQPAALRVVRSPLGATGAAASFPPEGEAWALEGWSQQVSVSAAATSSGCRYWQPSVRERTHANLSRDTLGPSYSQCDYGNGCGCGVHGAPAAAALGAVALALRWRKSRRRAR